MDRRVRATKKDREGNIIALCCAGQSWSPRRKADVIKDIVNSKRSYYVQEEGRRTYVRIVAGVLQTTPDVSSNNNLSRLPEG